MRHLYSSLLFLLPLISVGQNLVPNGDLEDYIECPDTNVTPQLAYLSNHAAEWQVLSGSPDYFHECSPTISPFNNLFGSEVPHSGSGFMAFAPYVPNWTIIMEIPKIKLSSPLESEEQYYFQMFVSLTDSCNYAVGEVGVHFSVDEPIVTEPFYQYFEPQIENDPITNPLNSKTGWTKISGIFTAIGGEEWIAIGVFRHSTELTVEQVSNHPDDDWEVSYYYVDDVLLTPYSEWLSIEEQNIQFSIYPNPATDNLRIESQTPLAQIKLTDLAGRTSIHETLRSAQSDNNIDVSSLPSGIYFLEAITPYGRRSVQKVVLE